MTSQTIPQRLKQLAARGALASSVALFGPAAALGDEAVASEDAAKVIVTDEDSVLVGTRKAEADAAEQDAEAAPGESTLEPIPQPAEAQPELAGPKPEVAPAVEPEPPIEQEPKAEQDSIADSAPQPESIATDAVVESEMSETDAVAADTPAEPAPVADAAPRVATKVDTKTPRVDPSDIANVYRSQGDLEPARFHGVVPGKTTGEEIIAAWGEPESESESPLGRMLHYKMAPFAGVDALLETLVETDEDGDTTREVVTLLKVELAEQERPTRLAQRLRMDEIGTVQIFDETGATQLGVAYPEKGMVMLLAEQAPHTPPTTPQFVTHLVIQPLDAEAFLLRAEQAPYNALETRIADLEQAIRIKADHAAAHARLAGVYRQAGASNKALAAAATATEIDAEDDAFRLRHAECLADAGQHDEAVLLARKVIDSENASSITRAGALHLMGRLASLGEAIIAEKAIGFQRMAIDVADELATSSDPILRRNAKRLLVDSHLAIAREISRRKYADKKDVVAQWIGRASGLAEEMVSSGDGGIELRLQIATEALATIANLRPASDPAPWIKEAEEAAVELLADSDDKLFTGKVEWLLGEANYHALRISHSRKEIEQGVAYGAAAIRHLSIGARTGAARPGSQTLVGKLYFHIGALHAVLKQDHAAAAKWYDKASPLLDAGKAESQLVAPRREGEALVSMAVSYWEQGRRTHAVDLTAEGAELMEKAVAAGVLDETTLAVPYGNLATMHKQLGNRNESARYAKLARVVRATATPAQPQVQQATKPQPAPKTARRRESQPAPPRNTSAQRRTSPPTAAPSKAQQRTAMAPAEPPQSGPTEPAPKRRTGRRGYTQSRGMLR